MIKFKTGEVAPDDEIVVNRLLKEQMSSNSVIVPDRFPIGFFKN